MISPMNRPVLFRRNPARQHRRRTARILSVTLGVGVFTLLPLPQAQAFDGANPPGCHYDGGTLCKGGYHINMKGQSDSLNDHAVLYEIPDGQTTGTVIWEAKREHHTRNARRTAEFWTYVPKPGYHYQAALVVDGLGVNGRRTFTQTLSPNTDYCFSTVKVLEGPRRTRFGHVGVEAWWLALDASNSDSQPGNCNLK